MLTEFFTFCLNDPDKDEYLYRDFPEHFVWNHKDKYWSKRKGKKATGHVNAANPSEGERYFLRLLLNHVRRPTSFEDLLTYNSVTYKTFKAAAEKRGLLQSDDWIFECLMEATTFQMPAALRRLFATLLVHNKVGNVIRLWEHYYKDLSEDFVRDLSTSSELLLRKTLRSICQLLESMGKNISDYDLPPIPPEQIEDNVSGKREIIDEMAVKTPPEDLRAVLSLTPEQRNAFDIIMDHVKSKTPGIFFVDGPGGTGKTFLYRALLATVRSANKIAIAIATSGVAASILPGGRTSHSRFKIPIDGTDVSMCNICKQSGISVLLQMAELIIWDEAPMAKRWDIEAVDRTLRDILGNESLFGGKVVVFGGDFRQVLPVIPRATRAESVNASLVRSYLWPQMFKFQLTKNMRVQADPWFSDFLLRVGNGTEPTNTDGLIQVPSKMVINPKKTVSPGSALIEAIFPRSKEHGNSPHYITSRAILVTRNECVDILNQQLITAFPGNEYRYTSYDKAIDDASFYPEEFLNTLTPNGLPPHELSLKVNSPIMLLRNLSPSEGLCNGTRMVCKGFNKNVIHAEIAFGQHAGNQVLLPRIPLRPPKHDGTPIQFEHVQFPIRLSFAMTINKAQGQTIPRVGIYLPQHVFSHGQLYVALSRGTSMATTKLVVLQKLKAQGKESYTKNIVYKEVLPTTR